MLQYRTIFDFFSEFFPGRVQKIPVNAGLGCPGRCAYCNNASFQPSYARGSISSQLEAGVRFCSKKAAQGGYLAYFQSFSNTYGPTEKLISLYEEALSFPGIVGLVIATRPDCLQPDLLDWFENRFGRKAPENHPFLLMEIGIESTKDETLEVISRGHDFRCSQDAVRELDSRGILVGAHLILGLPGEGPEDFAEHARRLSELPLSTLKLHQLQIIKGTPLADMYLADMSSIHPFTVEEYSDAVRNFVKELRPDIALDRFVSEAPRDMVLAPSWGLKPSEFASLL